MCLRRGCGRRPALFVSPSGNRGDEGSGDGSLCVVRHQLKADKAMPCVVLSAMALLQAVSLDNHNVLFHRGESLQGGRVLACNWYTIEQL
ncbi:hypothetical protein PoB_004786500 [Plakobranchus ocellatus]|uniref:Uncharacterized protein n=1 Tax=Plakobranchus ocellatus TaxID=259542 RepID=A0AAV4BQI2_9GAST|nr:hypothetical protein PoB_004786500 [Plakobranchus ocellatus]